jgi:Zn-dependent protease with chaperone function
MALHDQLAQYTSLLRIRQTARRRDARIIGSVFLMSVLAFVALGLLGDVSGRTVYLLIGILIAFGVSFLMAWIRLKIVTSNLELAAYLQQDRHTNS